MGLHQRRFGLAAACCGLLTWGGLAVPPAFAQTDTPGKVVNIDVANADFGTVIGMLERDSGVDVTIRPGDHPFKRVTVHLVDAPLEKAMRRIAYSAHATFRKDSDGGYTFEPESDETDASPSPQVDRSAQAGSDVQQASPQPTYAPGDLQWRSLILQHAVPADILKLLHWDGDVVNMDPFQPLHLSPSHPEFTSTQPMTFLQQPNPYGAPNSYGAPSVPLGSGAGGQSNANYAAHRSPEGSPNDQANQFPGLGGINGGGVGGNPFGGAGGNPFGGAQGGFTPQPFQPGQGAGGQGARQAALPNGVDKIFALQSNNSLLIHATPDGYNEVKNLIKILDIAPRQVQIKVEFVTASVADVDNVGVNFDLVPYPGLELSTSQGNGALGGVVSGFTPTFLQYTTGNIAAQLFQTLTRTRGKVVQSPIITTTNNVPATIEIETEIPFFTTTVVNTGGLNNSTATGSQANFLPLTTGLTIAPRINSDDSVTMNLSPQITGTTGQVVQGIPGTITQSLTTLRTVRSGDTMVLGGLVTKNESASTQRIPILSDIPFLGGIFRTRNKQVNDQELLIFVTPTIIGESNDSATANANGGQSVTITP